MLYGQVLSDGPKGDRKTREKIFREAELVGRPRNGVKRIGDPIERKVLVE